MRWGNDSFQKRNGHESVRKTRTWGFCISAVTIRRRRVEAGPRAATHRLDLSGITRVSLLHRWLLHLMARGGLIPRHVKVDISALCHSIK